jgi:hypothetical protein
MRRPSLTIESGTNGVRIAEGLMAVDVSERMHVVHDMLETTSRGGILESNDVELGMALSRERHVEKTGVWGYQ